MNKSSLMFGLLMATVVTDVARADYPMVDAIANKVVNKYQTASCQQLWQEKAEGKKPPGEMEQRAIAMLKQDAGMRTEFFNRISAPIVTKMFECGMIP